LHLGELFVTSSRPEGKHGENPVKLDLLMSNIVTNTIGISGLACQVTPAESITSHGLHPDVRNHQSIFVAVVVHDRSNRAFRAGKASCLHPESCNVSWIVSMIPHSSSTATTPSWG